MSEIAPIISVILLAGGSGSRMNGAVDDKILLPLDGKPVFQHSLEAFRASAVVTRYVVVYKDAMQKAALSRCTKGLGTEVSWVQGGHERQHSVFNGLNACPKNTDIVLIHDCARPLITPTAIKSVAQSALQHGSACIAKKVSDTIKSVTRNLQISDTYDLESLDRSKLWAMETPQAFKFTLIRDAYETVIKTNQMITDDLSAIEGQGVSTKFIENQRPNQKLTTPNDIHFLEFILQQDK